MLAIRPYRIHKILPFISCKSASHSPQKSLNSTGRSIVDHLHMRKPRMFFSSILSIKRSRAKKLWSCGRPLGYKKRIIHFHQSGQTISDTFIRHCFENLVSNQPHASILLGGKQPFYLRYPCPNFAYRHMIDHPIPLDQRNPGPIEKCSCYHAGHAWTELTVKQMSVRQIPNFHTSALTTKKFVWQSMPCKVLCGSSLSGNSSWDSIKLSCLYFLWTYSATQEYIPESIKNQIHSH